MQVAKTLSTSKTLKDRDVLAKSKSRRLTSASKATSLSSKVGNGSYRTNELHISSGNDNVQTSKLETPCDEISLLYDLPNGVGRPNVSSSPADHQWNRPKRKAQELDDVCCGINILDIIFTNDNNLVDEDLKSTSLFELAKQVRPSFFSFFLNMIVFLFLIIIF